MKSLINADDCIKWCHFTIDYRNIFFSLDSFIFRSRFFNHQEIFEINKIIEKLYNSLYLKTNFSKKNFFF